MSWSIHSLTNLPAPEAKQKVADDANLPQPIKDYIVAGIDGLATYHKDDNVMVTVTGHGHVCDGTNYEITTATLDVRRGTA